MVLWTEDEFQGDVKIEYEYTRLDNETNCVNILYIQASGSGEAPYHEDITQWYQLAACRVLAMRMYFDHMHTYHISYAAFQMMMTLRVIFVHGATSQMLQDSKEPAQNPTTSLKDYSRLACHTRSPS